MNTYKVTYNMPDKWGASVQGESTKVPTHIKAKDFFDAIHKLQELNLEFYIVEAVVLDQYVKVLE